MWRSVCSNWYYTRADYFFYSDCRSYSTTIYDTNSGSDSVPYAESLSSAQRGSALRTAIRGAYGAVK
jgi:hypothetical protein